MIVRNKVSSWYNRNNLPCSICATNIGYVSLTKEIAVKIYTRTGDAGETSLFGGGRVRKDHVRIEAYGTIDELNATLGVARATILKMPILGEESGFQAEKIKALNELLGTIQNRLFDLGAELATPDPAKHGLEAIDEHQIRLLEEAIDAYEDQLDPLRQFILPGGSLAASQLHVSRCVCRRAERQLVGINPEQPVREILLRYLNRLSDLLFVLARTANSVANIDDQEWQKIEK